MEEEPKNSDKVNEPSIRYDTADSKRITFCTSFEEAEEYQRKMMANMTVEERMTQLEKMRKRFMSECLLPDGTWRPLKRIITIERTNYK